ncbi:hypothetical protein IF1G_08220 [Cordyceps javanica]|uniref:Uncharacterized protein n=1 Tax=Cordyceps javanica TaxID=43265 RepID=A0A545UTW3_9HYPO|nr:hypothetical protein IF1G_08220 [Cordyceps javanica]
MANRSPLSPPLSRHTRRLPTAALPGLSRAPRHSDPDATIYYESPDASRLPIGIDESRIQMHKY